MLPAAPPPGTNPIGATLAQLDPTRLVRAHGRALLVIDGTEYPKRSRGRGTRDRHMQHRGRVRTATGKGSGTTYGDVDIWAGLVLKGKRFLPLAGHLFSSAHSQVASQNQVEAAVLTAALTAAAQLPWPALVVADRSNRASADASGGGTWRQHPSERSGTIGRRHGNPGSRCCQK